jgi:uncharacterized protein YjiS (DUF1127 family)
LARAHSITEEGPKETVMSVVPIIQFRDEPGTIRAASRRVAGLFFHSGRLVSWIVREVRIRRDMRRLGEFSDDMLRDIGIARSDIEGAVRRGHDSSMP